MTSVNAMPGKVNKEKGENMQTTILQWFKNCWCPLPLASIQVWGSFHYFKVSSNLELAFKSCTIGFKVPISLDLLSPSLQMLIKIQEETKIRGVLNKD